MSTVMIEARVRDVKGKRSAKLKRREGVIPCVVYGGGDAPEAIEIGKDVINKYAYRSNFFSTVFEMNGVGKKGQKFVVKDVQFHPVTDEAMHVDFMRVGKDSKVSIRVPLRFINEAASPGLKRGGVLNVLVYEMDVVCSPDEIPEHIDIDLTGFEFHHTVHAMDVKLPDGVSLPITSKNETIATVVAPTIVKTEEEGAASAE